MGGGGECHTSGTIYHKVQIIFNRCGIYINIYFKINNWLMNDSQCSDNNGLLNVICDFLAQLVCILWDTEIEIHKILNVFLEFSFYFIMSNVIVGNKPSLSWLYCPLWYSIFVVSVRNQKDTDKSIYDNKSAVIGKK